MNDRQAFIATIADSLRKADELEQESNVEYRGGQPFGPSLLKLNQLRSDLTAHLVFADWLEEQGDPWHELIRVSCERIRLENTVWCSLEWTDAEWGGRERTTKLITDECNNSECPKCGPLHTLRIREQELQRELNPFSDSVKVTWDRGLIVGLEIDDVGEWLEVGKMRDFYWEPFQSQPICTIRLRDWHGIERSLPRNPVEALPWLFKLELPSSARFSEVSNQIGRNGWAVQNLIEDQFGTLNGEPRVRVEFFINPRFVGSRPTGQE